MLTGRPLDFLSFSATLDLRIDCGKFQLSCSQQTQVSKKLAMQPARIWSWQNFEDELIAWKLAISPEIRQMPVRADMPLFCPVY